MYLELVLIVDAITKVVQFGPEPSFRYIYRLWSHDRLGSVSSGSSLNCRVHTQLSSAYTVNTVTQRKYGRRIA